MAEKGLIEKSTLQGFADEVRRLAESEQTGTPAEMLALLQTIEAGMPLPSWISEIDFATVTSTSTTATSITIPTVLTKKPTNFLVFSSTDRSNSNPTKVEILFQTTDNYNCGVLRVRQFVTEAPGVFINSSSSSPVATATFSSSKSTVTITTASQSCFTSEYEYKVIMWW